MDPLTLAIVAGGAYLLLRGRAGAAAGLPPGAVGAFGDGSSRASPLPVSDDTDLRQLKGRWFVLPDGTVGRVPTDAEVRPYFASIVLIPRLLTDHSEWGPYINWYHRHYPGQAVPGPVAQVFGAAVGFAVGGPAGAATGAKVGGAVASRT